MAPYLLKERRSPLDDSSKKLLSLSNSILDTKHASQQDGKYMTSKKRAALSAKLEKLLRDGRFLTTDFRASKDQAFSKISSDDKSRLDASRKQLQDEVPQLAFDFRRDPAMLRRDILGELRYLPLNPSIAATIDATISIHSGVPLYLPSSLFPTNNIGLSTPTPTTSIHLLPSAGATSNQWHNSEKSQNNLPTPAIIGLSIFGALLVVVGVFIAIRMYGRPSARRSIREYDSPIFGGPEILSAQPNALLSWTPFVLPPPSLGTSEKTKSVHTTLCNMGLVMGSAGHGSVFNAAGQEISPEKCSQTIKRKSSRGSFSEKQQQEAQYHFIARYDHEDEEPSPHLDIHMHSIAITTPDDVLAVSGSERRAPVQSSYYALSSHSAVSTASSTPSMSSATKSDIPESDPTPSMTKSDSQREQDIRALGAVLGFEHPLPLGPSPGRVTEQPGWDAAIDDLGQSHKSIPARSQEVRMARSGESILNGDGNVDTQESGAGLGLESWLSTHAVEMAEKGGRHTRAQRGMSVPPPFSLTQAAGPIQEHRRSAA